MDEREVDNGRAIGSVRAAISMYGGKINNQGTYPMRKTQKATANPEKNPSKAPELLLARKRIDQLNQDAKMAQSEKSQAELELLKAKKVVRELTSQIKESKSKAKDHNKVKSVGVEDHQYEELTRELESLKGELSKLKLDMALALEEKSRAEKEAEAASLRLESYMSSAEQLRRAIEEANEEEVLVEVAQIQARKELAEVEAQRKEDRDRFSSQIEETRKTISILREDIEQIKDLEEKLADTNSDVEVLQHELSLIREMDRRVERKDPEVQTVMPEQVDDVKKELDSIQGGAFDLMTSMDALRNELKEVMEDKARIQKLEEEIENSMMNLNSELLKARDKLEVVNASEENERTMFSSLSVALDNLEKEKELALKERESTQEEISSIRTEIQKTEIETDSNEDRLSAALQELTAAKSAEAKALKKLKALAEKAAKTRASASKKKSTIAVSRFEYGYLTGSAVAAQELAEKKIAAALAWAEALRASEREMNVRIEVAKREVEQLRVKEEEEVKRAEKSLSAIEVAEGELQNQRKQGNRRSLQARKSMRENSYSLTPVRQAKFRRPYVGSPTAKRLNTSGSFTMKRRTRVMLKIGKYFASKEVVN